MNNLKIYNLGSLNIDYVYSVDHFVSAGETLGSQKMEIFPGGKGLNQSVATAKAGSPVIHGGMIGKDGEFLLEILKNSGADASRVKIIDTSSGHAIIQVDKSGQNCILLFGGTNRLIDREYAEEFLCDAGKDDILILQNEISGLADIFEIAHEKQMQIVFNPSPLADNIKTLSLEFVKWWFCNEIEGEALFGSADPQKIAENFIKKYPDSNLILTLGKKGCLFKNKDLCFTVPIYDAEVVDTTAAGDTFTGYFISCISKDIPAKQALETATKASAITVSRMGASSSIPTIEEVKKLK